MFFVSVSYLDKSFKRTLSDTKHWFHEVLAALSYVQYWTSIHFYFYVLCNFMVSTNLQAHTGVNHLTAARAKNQSGRSTVCGRVCTRRLPFALYIAGYIDHWRSWSLASLGGGGGVQGLKGKGAKNWTTMFFFKLNYSTKFASRNPWIGLYKKNIREGLP